MTLGIARVAADDAVRAEPKHVAKTSDCGRAALPARAAPARRTSALAEHDLIDFVEGEAGDLDRRVGEDQLLELDLELRRGPTRPSRQPIDGKPQAPAVRFR